MEKKWPPLENCEHMLGEDLTKQSWEDNIDPNSPDALYLYVRKSYLTALRKSRGYDVYENPIDASFSGMDRSLYENSACVKDVAEFLIDHITQKTGKAHKLVDIQKVVMTTSRGFLLTISAKEETEEAPEVVYLGSVFMEGFRKEEFVLLECFIKPDEDAPESALEFEICGDGNLAPPLPTLMGPGQTHNWSHSSFAPSFSVQIGPGQSQSSLYGPPFSAQIGPGQCYYSSFAPPFSAQIGPGWSHYLAPPLSAPIGTDWSHYLGPPLSAPIGPGQIRPAWRTDWPRSSSFAPPPPLPASIGLGHSRPVRRNEWSLPPHAWARLG